MTDRRSSEDGAGLLSSRRELLKGLLLGGAAPESRLETVKALVMGQSVASSSRVGSGTTTAGVSSQSSWNPIPTRATQNVSVRSIAEQTTNGPPYQLTEVAAERGLLDVDHPTNPRMDPPFALRELITSQAITTSGIKNTAIDSPSGWRNWVGDFGRSSGLTRFRPDSRRELIEAIVENARAEATIRAVGAGHSHSKAAVPDENFIELSWYEDGHNGGVKGLVRDKKTTWQSAGPNQVRVEAGAPIRYLARKLLLETDKALGNRGSFDAQTLAGAINTSTHGTGASLGALSDAVESVELVTVLESPAQEGKPLVRAFRVEPENGPTDRVRFEDDVASHETTLIKDDDVFHSVVVGYGCMGVAYSYTLSVRPRYWLWENSENVFWTDFKDNMKTLRGDPDPQAQFRSFTPTDPNNAQGSRHFQFLVNIAQVQVAANSPPNDRQRKRLDDPRCLVIQHREPHEYTPPPSFDRWPTEPNNWPHNWPPERTGKSWLREVIENTFGSSFNPEGGPGGASLGMNKNFQRKANNPPFHGQGSMSGANTVPSGNYTASFVALKRPTELDPNPPFTKPPKKPPLAISTEIAVPADQVTKAVEAVLDRVIEHELTFHIPMGVRFVDRSEHFLAPEYNGENDPEGPVAKVEVPYAVEPWKSIVNDPLGEGRIKTIKKSDMLDYAKRALAAVEDELVTMSENGELGFARPHMGKTNTIETTNGVSDLRNHYEQFDTWQTVHEAFDPFGTFNNAFTDSKGISIDPDEGG